MHVGSVKSFRQCWQKSGLKWIEYFISQEFVDVHKEKAIAANYSESSNK